MNKKHIIIISISVIVLAVAAGVWRWEKMKKAKNAKNNISQYQQKITNDQDDQLVWYEVPELGIRFKVTLDAKDNLKYTNNNYETKDFVMKVNSGIFYSTSETNSSFEGCKLSENGNSCGFFYIYKVSREQTDKFKNKYNKPWCENTGGKIILENNEDIVCYFGEKTLLEDEEYKKLFHIVTCEENKHFGVFLNQIQFID